MDFGRLLTPRILTAIAPGAPTPTGLDVFDSNLPTRQDSGMRATLRERILFAISVAALPALAAAQGVAWPAKAVRVIVPFTAGSPVEIPARPVTQRLTDTLGQSFLIDNRPGASGIIGTELVAK